MSNEGPAPTAEDKARYEAAKKELMKALFTKRSIDKQLVGFLVTLTLPPGLELPSGRSHILRLRYSI